MSVKVCGPAMASVVIRGIPKEGWKLAVGIGVSGVADGVVIRGIPKEGWKFGEGKTVGVGEGKVVIRGIPKEGWKSIMATANPPRAPNRW